MQKWKRNAQKIIFVAAIVVCFALFLTACGKKTPEQSSTPQATTPEATTPAHAHAWEMTTEGFDCTRGGEVDYACTGCAETKHETIPRGTHTFDEGTVLREPADRTDGLIKYTCTVCGFSYEDDIPAPKPSEDVLKAERYAELDAEYAARFDKITDETMRAAVKRLYDLYDPEAILLWMARMYDPETGLFYYAKSARDYEGFAPDIESTFQIVQMMGGMSKYYGSVKAFLGEKGELMMQTLLSLQLESDGYFYSSAFSGEKSTAARRARELDEAVQLMATFGVSPLYPTAYDRLGAGSFGYATAPKYFSENSKYNDPVLMESYLRNLVATHNFEGFGNEIATHILEFKAGGTAQALLDICDTLQDPATGLWVSEKLADGTYIALNGAGEPLYGTFTGAYKLLYAYDACDRAVNYGEKILDAAIEAICLENPENDPRLDPRTICYLANPWGTICCLRFMLDNGSMKADSLTREVYREKLRVASADMIDILCEKIELFRKDDGSISYYQAISASNLYGTHTSLGYEEGDANAMHMGFNIMLNMVNTAFETGGVQFFSHRHGDTFLSYLDKITPPVKKKIESKPYGYDFADGTLGASYTNVNPTFTVLDSTETQISITQDPTNAENKVLNLNKTLLDKRAGGAALEVKMIDTMTMTDESVMKLKFKFYMSSEGARMVESGFNMTHEFNVITGASTFYRFGFSFDSNNTDQAPTGLYFSDVKHAAYSGDLKFTGFKFEFDTWYDIELNFRITGFTEANPQFEGVDLIVNGEKLYTSKNFMTSTDAGEGEGSYWSLPDSEKPSYGEFKFSNAQVKLKIMPQGRANSNVYIDDLIFVLDTPTVDDNNPIIPIS